MILGPRGGFMFTGAVEYPEGASDRAPAYDRNEYVMFGFSTHRDILHIQGAPEDASGEVVRAAVLTQVSDWSPDLRRLVERAEAPSLTAFSAKSSVPIGPWTTGRVTLLGDALHNMTPFRGVGANTALRDAALLRDRLRDVEGGHQDLIPALATYEHDMIGYGFSAVQASLAQMNRVHTRSPLKRFATKAAFRVLDSWPTLRRRVVDLGNS